MAIRHKKKLSNQGVYLNLCYYATSFLLLFITVQCKNITKENMEIINDTQFVLLIYSVLLRRSGVELMVVYNKTNITYGVLYDIPIYFPSLR